MLNKGRYLDGPSFTRLFRQRRRQHHGICEGLAELAKNVGRLMHCANETDRKDAIAGALLFAIERIDKFDVHRGGSAFAYFTTMLYRRMLRHLQTKRREQVFSVVIDDALHAAELDTAIDTAIAYSRVR